MCARVYIEFFTRLDRSPLRMKKGAFQDEVVKVVVFRFLRKLLPNTRVPRGSYTQNPIFHYFNYLNGVKLALFQFKDSGVTVIRNQ